MDTICNSSNEHWEPMLIGSVDWAPSTINSKNAAALTEYRVDGGLCDVFQSQEPPTNWRARLRQCEQHAEAVSLGAL